MYPDEQILKSKIFKATSSPKSSSTARSMSSFETAIAPTSARAAIRLSRSLSDFINEIKADQNVLFDLVLASIKSAPTTGEVNKPDRYRPGIVALRLPQASEGIRGTEPRL
ncbi:hypothetical protein D8674_007474 [Pyrus ussuriensis x Pyrus communis]|uniref:Uncharacterized protein n=1 Tax=Pyrus ussuriensis x Pyrus communis TaxID=2448454 RepID=A0A5N5HPZ3_9ROSA|nr:hypothetical protein D8674_007474 [Pyrus ussuriensis x Pyrus communis]